MKRWILIAGVLAVAPIGGFAFWTQATRVCTQAGCGSGLSVYLNREMQDGVVYDVELCLDDECWETQAIFEEGLSGPDNPLGVNHEGTVNLDLPNQTRPLTSDLSLQIWADGEQIVRVTREVTFNVQRPNGRFCPPTCYWARLEI